MGTRIHSTCTRSSLRRIIAVQSCTPGPLWAVHGKAATPTTSKQSDVWGRHWPSATPSTPAEVHGTTSTSTTWRSLLLLERHPTRECCQAEMAWAGHGHHEGAWSSWTAHRRVLDWPWNSPFEGGTRAHQGCNSSARCDREGTWPLGHGKASPEQHPQSRSDSLHRPQQEQQEAAGRDRHRRGGWWHGWRSSWTTWTPTSTWPMASLRWWQTMDEDSQLTSPQALRAGDDSWRARAPLSARACHRHQTWKPEPWTHQDSRWVATAKCRSGVALCLDRDNDFLHQHRAALRQRWRIQPWDTSSWWRTTFWRRRTSWRRTPFWSRTRTTWSWTFYDKPWRYLTWRKRPRTRSTPCWTRSTRSTCGFDKPNESRDRACRGAHGTICETRPYLGERPQLPDSCGSTRTIPTTSWRRDFRPTACESGKTDNTAVQAKATILWTRSTTRAQSNPILWKALVFWWEH